LFWVIAIAGMAGYSPPLRASLWANTDRKCRVMVTRDNAAAVHADAPHPSAPVRLSFAQLLKRVFDIDIAQCPRVAAVP
jgi:hypothetical protein